MLSLFVFSSHALAADGDIPTALVFDDKSVPVSLGTGLLRGGDLWVPEDAMARMGVSLAKAYGNKGFFINIPEPVSVFGVPELSRLAGNSLSLYFSSLADGGVSYFNVKGMSPVTGLTYNIKDGTAYFSKAPKSLVSSKKRTSMAAGKISLVWDHVPKHNQDTTYEPRMRGLDILSPTWFNLLDGSGTVANRASFSYVEAAHNKGYQVWALASNGFNKADTSALFRNARAMNLYMARLLAYCKLYDLDGINIDFEGMDMADRDSFTRFMSELAPLLASIGVKSSVDVHIPANTNSSRMHDRNELAKYVDYIMLMAYDEHWRTCPRAGSVASLPWVEAAVQKTLAEGVPASKLVLGVPFYMRLWEETQAAGGVKVKAKTLSMSESDGIIASRGLVPVWDNKTGQYFYSYKSGAVTCKVWVEDSKSIAAKAALVDKYKLAGIAAWRKGHEKPEIWNVIADALGK